jgi:glyoxylase-like metal-dependent hydrolase (beta-lactamase superfamily II)
MDFLRGIDMNTTAIKKLSEVLISGEAELQTDWQVRVVSSAECQSYVVWNTKTHEGILVDPKVEDVHAYHQIKSELKNYLWLAVIDTHTHADHISAAAEMAANFGAPLIMHSKSATSRAHLRVSLITQIPSQSGPLHLIPTPGHTPDSLCVIWGPYAFTGDTILYGDIGRDDLPGGNAEAHFESVQTLKRLLKQETLVFPGHDNKGGQVCSWATQLKSNPSLNQEREEFIRECAAFDGKAPALLKKALFENLK